ncbi:MAG: hypothetical protein DRJ62_01725 [Thermoprotei archaeon]|nr:MAG: hypothetical protein DRJ62_01725 [Thermoprotei archaeon]
MRGFDASVVYMSLCWLVVWIATGRCNLSCRHCYAVRFNGMRELSTHEAIEMIRGLAEIRAKHLSITGGEPLLRRDLVKLIREAQELGLEVSVVTNTMLLSDELASFLAKRDVEVQVSFDAASEKTYLAIRGPYWSRLMDRVGVLRSFGAKFRPIMTINTINYFEAGKYVELCESLGAMEAALIPVIPVGRASLDIMPEPWMVEEAFKLASSAADERGFKVEFWCSPFAKALIKSKWASPALCMINSSLDIAPDGSIMLCDTIDVKVSDVSIGIPKAWEEYLNNRLVKELSTPIGLKEACSKCPYAQECLGGCHARAKIVYGDLKMPDPLCPLAHGVKRPSRGASSA